MILRRVLCFLLCLSLFSIPVRAESAPKYVALTFDDGPSGRYTARLLEGLAKRDVTATFFLCGYRLKEYPKLAARIQNEGHEIGLHGYSHTSMKKMDNEHLEREIADTFALLPAGCRPVFLRPPGGLSSRAVENAARQAGLAILSWTVDPRDWATHDAPAVAAAVTGKVTDGDVILMHDMSDSSVDAAFAIIDRLKKQGFQFVTAKELARLKGYAIEPGKTYKSFS